MTGNPSRFRISGVFCLQQLYADILPPGAPRPNLPLASASGQWQLVCGLAGTSIQAGGSAVNLVRVPALAHVKDVFRIDTDLMGAEGFAERARRELRATGETAASARPPPRTRS